MNQLHKQPKEVVFKDRHPATNALDDDTRKVGIGIKVENVRDINSNSNSFIATIKLSKEWELTEQEVSEYEEDMWSRTGGRPPWEPQVTMPGALEIQLRTELPARKQREDRNPMYHDIFKIKDKTYTIVYERVRAEYSEVLQLQNFPYDCQDLTLVLQSEDMKLGGMLCPRFKTDKFASVDLTNCAIGQQWALYPPIISCIDGHNSHSRSGRSDSKYIMQIKLRRRPEYYLHKIIILCGLLAAGSLLAFFLKRDDSNRVILAFTILLTLVAFQLATDGELPNVRYYTLLDVYILFCQGFIFFIGLICAALNKFDDDIGDGVDRVDEAILIVMTVVFVFFQIFYFQWIVRRSSNSELEKLDLPVLELFRWIEKHQPLGMLGDMSFHVSKARVQRLIPDDDSMGVRASSARFSLGSGEGKQSIRVFRSENVDRLPAVSKRASMAHLPVKQSNVLKKGQAKKPVH